MRSERLNFGTSEISRRLDASAGLTRVGEPFLEYVDRVAPRIILYDHLIQLGNTLQRVADGEIKRLAVFMPPRHGKSEFISRLFSSYFLHRYPGRQVGLVGHTADLAGELSGDARDYFVTAGGDLHSSTKAKSKWRTLSGGGMWSAGLRGSIHGKGYHLGIIDDPVKSSDEASSPTFREKTWRRYQGDFVTRAEPGAATILLMTRWHQSDLAGKILAEEKEADWYVISMQALYRPDERIELPDHVTDLTPQFETRTERDEPLCPGRAPKDRLLRLEGSMLTTLFSALFQQAPSPASGNIIKKHWFRYWVPRDQTELAQDEIVITDDEGETFRPLIRARPKEYDAIITSWDCSFKDKADSSKVSGQVWGMQGPNYFLLDNDTQHRDFPSTVYAIRRMAKKWPGAVGHLIEDKANGPAVIATLDDEIPGIIPCNPRGGKDSRLHSASYIAKGGNIYVPHPSLYEWVESFIEEWVLFPGAAFDDQVDAGTQALLDLSAGRYDLPSLIGQVFE